MRRAVSVVALTFCLGASACGGGDDDPPCSAGPDVDQFTLGRDESRELADGLTTIAMRHEHFAYLREDWVRVPEAPYLEVDGQWFELVGNVTFPEPNESRVLEVQLMGCRIEDQAFDDYVVRVLTSCTVRAVRKCVTRVAKVVPERLSYVARFGSQYATTSIPLVYDGTFALRSAGFYVGYVDQTVDPWEVKTASIGLEVVTNFGARSFELADDIWPIIGHEEHAVIGPYEVGIRILDIANSNTRCDPYCRDVLDVEVVLEPKVALPLAPRIIGYTDPRQLPSRPALSPAATIATLMSGG